MQIKSDMAELSEMWMEALKASKAALDSATSPAAALFRLFHDAIALRDAISQAVTLYEATKAAIGLDKLIIHHKQKLMMQWCELTSALFTSHDTSGLETTSVQAIELKTKVCNYIKSDLNSHPKEKDALLLLAKFKNFLLDEKVQFALLK
jgi:hypothetical protein